MFLTGPGRLELRQLPMPEPGPGELLVRIDAATTCGTDVKVFRRGGHPTMLTLPTPFGHEAAATVVRTGAGAAQAEGDAVVVGNSAACGMCQPCRHQRENLCRGLVYLNGAFADYMLVPAVFAERSVHLRPPGLDPAIAAMAEPLACAVHCLERSLAAWSGPPAEARALIIGCGPLGLMLTDLFRSVRTRVSVLDPHPRRLAAARTFGATETHRGRAGEVGIAGAPSTPSASHRGRAGKVRDQGGRDPARRPDCMGAGEAPSTRKSSARAGSRSPQWANSCGEGGLGEEGEDPALQNRQPEDQQLEDRQPEDQHFDFTVDATGSPAGWQHAVSRLAPGGVAALFGGCRPGAALKIDAERVHYQEQTLLGVYHHRPASFRAALERLLDAPERYGRLIERELPLDRLADALDLMISRRALKVAIRPHPDQQPA